MEKINIKNLILALFVITMFGLTTNVKAEDKYTVTLDIYNGKETNTVEVDASGYLTKPEDPVREGYTFIGWYKDESYLEEYDFSTPVTSDMTLYAKWEANEYTVTFMNDGQVVTTVKVKYDEQVQKPEDPKSEEYIFKGWYKDSDYENKFSFLTKIKKDITLYAYFDSELVKTHDITFVPGMGMDPFIVEVEDGEIPESPYLEFENEEYSHIEWFSDLDKTIPYYFEDPVTEDIVLYARIYGEDNSEIIETPDTASPLQIGYIIGGIALALVGGYLVYSQKNSKRKS